MKVLFVPRGFPSINNPMSGNYEAVQAKALAAKGCHVSVLAIYPKPFYSLKNWKRISHRTVEDVSVYEGIYPSFPDKLFRLFRKIRNNFRNAAYHRIFERIVAEEGIPDIVHAHIVSFASLSIFMKDEKKLPFVITEHWSMMNRTVVPDWLRTVSQVYYKADAVICVSQVLADSLKKNFNVDSTVINNMVSNIFFKTKKIKRTDSTFKFIACGAFRLNRIKGFDILVDAFAQANLPKNVTLTIVGDGPDRAFIESKIAEHQISNQIHLVGVKTPEEVSDLFCNSDCFVLSSRLETFSIVVIEAMAKGLPVIATRSGGPETFLLPEHGMLVEKENVDELAHAMNKMIEHYTDYDSDEIRKYCYDHFSQDVIADQIISVYNKVINKNLNR